MGETTEISWCDKTFNPVIGCRKVSPGCKFCYAEKHVNRFGDFGTRVLTSDANWRKPLKWNREAVKIAPKCTYCGSLELDHHLKAGTYVCMDCQAENEERDCEYRPSVFCASLADVFESYDGPIRNAAGLVLNDKFEPACNADMHNNELLGLDHVRDRLFKLIDATQSLDWLLLTKRPENIQHMWCDTPVGAAERDAYFPYPPPGGFKHRENVWLGTSVENLDYLHRIDTLKSCGSLAGKLFLSIEPLLGPLPTLGEHIDGIDWVIVGGESGHNSRPMNPDWVRSIRDQCETHGVAFHFNQWGEYVPYEHCGSPPLIESQHGFNFDSHDLPEGIIDHEPVNGWYWPDGLSDVVYRRVGKKIAGRKLDGVTHDAFP